MHRIQIYDTTLRDGTQRAGMSLSSYDKLRIAQRLDELGVAFIEGGWPGSNPKDAQFFEQALEVEWRQALIAAFGATRRVGIGPEDDPNLRALVDSAAPVCTLFGKSWTLHVREILRTTLDDNLEVIHDSIAYLRGLGRRVIFDAEHFFDGYRADATYALATLEAAVDAGAEAAVLCDTNGGTMPWEVETIVAEAVQRLGERAVIGIHAHNDGDCAVSNSLAAVRAGASQVQGTINGYGERCGNANLCSIIPNLELKLDRPCLHDGALPLLTEAATYISEVANQVPNDYAAYVGRNAFAHKGGVHVSAMRRNPSSYQHIEPERVGNEMRVVVSELSGRSNLMSKAEELRLALGSGEAVGRVVKAIKANEARGFSYEAAEASVALMLAREEPDYEPPYRLIDYMVTVEHRKHRGTFAEATVKVDIAGNTYHTAAEGDGPVNALDGALRKALEPTFPALKNIKLTDYKVRILDGTEATSAVTRVLIDTTDGHRSWSTVGASTNIIEASWWALTDALEYGLLLQRAAPVKEETAIDTEGVPAVEQAL
jgi:2-isopropylmalate synthase